MGIKELEAPSRATGSKYDFPKEEVATAAKMLGEGKQPGNDGYSKEGEARSAAARLIDQLAEAQKAETVSLDVDVRDGIGSRVWEASKGKFAFVLKVGKRKPNPGTASENGSEPAE